MYEQLTKVFSFICMCLVCYVGYGIISTEATSYPITDSIQVWTQTWSTQSWEQETWWQRSDPITPKRVKQATTNNSKKNDHPEQKPLGTNTIKTRVFIKDWKEAYIKVQAVVSDEAISKHILYACINTRNQPHCVNSILWVSKAESSIFRNCDVNCLWVKPSWNLAKYENKKYGIDDRVKRYNDHWYANDNASEWINKSKYCQSSDCINPWSNWRISYNQFIWYVK